MADKRGQTEQKRLSHDMIKASYLATTMRKTDGTEVQINLNYSFVVGLG
jgi:hypothetical protein